MGVPFAAVRDPGHLSTPVLPLASVLRVDLRRAFSDATAEVFVDLAKIVDADPGQRTQMCPPPTGGHLDSLGTTSTGHPALSAAAVPVTESSIARHADGSSPSNAAAR